MVLDLWSEEYGHKYSVPKAPSVYCNIPLSLVIKLYVILIVAKRKRKKEQTMVDKTTKQKIKDRATQIQIHTRGGKLGAPERYVAMLH